eukprot:3224864-Pleurochrysis_carterae.AAC.1
MRLRLAFLMKHFGIPTSLIVNYDHTGLHFMQVRGKTWVSAVEDTSFAHNSRQGKEKETKQQGINDKRQCTGVVCTSADGDVLPGQLIVQGAWSSSRALPAVQRY